MIDRLRALASTCAALLGLFAMASCTSMSESSDAAKSPDDHSYRTGSRLPTREGGTGGAAVGSVNKDEWDAANRQREGGGRPSGALGQ